MTKITTPDHVISTRAFRTIVYSMKVVSILTHAAVIYYGSRWFLGTQITLATACGVRILVRALLPIDYAGAAFFNAQKDASDLILLHIMETTAKPAIFLALMALIHYFQ